MGVEQLNWMQRYAAEEFIEHEREGLISRRELIGRLVGICGTTSAAIALLAACSSSSTTTATTAGASTSTAATGTAAAQSTTSATAPTTAGAPAATTAQATTATTATTTSATTTNAAPATAGAAPVPPTNAPGVALLSVKADDPAVSGQDVTFPGPAGTVLGYLARPSAAPDSARPGIIVIHEIFGLTDHIRDVARRLAKVGYLAVAPDLASRAGGTAKAGNVGGTLTQGSVADRVADLDAGLAFLEQQKDFNGKLGVVGFCFGGGMTLSYAGAQPKVLAAVPYYGPTPQPPSSVSSTHAAILANYGANDARVNAGIPALEEALAGKTFVKKVYDGAGHAFNNDTGGAYNEKVALAAWTETLAWFATYLK